ncbi:hypothetical protein D3C87_1353550 [compost metagenome]
MMMAGTASAWTVSRLKLGSESSGRPCGTSPTSDTPLPLRSNSADQAMVRNTTSTGPARTMMAATPLGTPKRTSQFLRS